MGNDISGRSLLDKKLLIRHVALLAVVTVSLGLWAIPSVGAVSGWTDPTPLPANYPVPYGGQSAVTGPDGTDVVMWTEKDTVGTGYWVRRVVRWPGHATWSDLDTLRGIQPDPVAAVGPDGTLWTALTVRAPSPLVNLRFERPDGSGGAASPWGGSEARRWRPTVAVGQDGTILISSLTQSDTGPNAGVVHLEVSIKRPGTGWHQAVLSRPALNVPVPAGVAVNARGQAIVTFNEDTDPDSAESERIRAATLDLGTWQWNISTVSPAVAGQTQGGGGLIGADGTAAVMWMTDDGATRAWHLSTTPLPDTEGWSSHLVAPVQAWGLWKFAVDDDGSVTVMWSDLAGNPDWPDQSTLFARRLESGQWAQEATPLSSSQEDVDEYTSPGSMIQLADHQVAVLYGTKDRRLQLLTLDPDLTANSLMLSDGTSPAPTLAQLEIDGASRKTITWATSPNGPNSGPHTYYATTEQPEPPIAVTTPLGPTVTTAQLRGQPQVGRRLTCKSGYWVEATSITYQWLRNGTRIHHATAARYRLTDADKGQQLSCRVLADNAAGRTVLASDEERIHR